MAKPKHDLRTPNKHASAVDIDAALALAKREVEGTHMLTYDEYRRVAAALVKLTATLAGRGVRW